MCPYMLIKENDIPYCEPKEILCTMCVAGNMKTYNEIENNNNIKPIIKKR